MKLVIANILVLIIIKTNLYGQTWTLEQSVDSAFANNTKIAIAKNNLEITELKYSEIRSNLLPRLSVNGEYKYFIELPYQLLPLSVFGGPEGQFKETQFGVPHNINANLILQAPIYSANLMGNIEKLETTKKIVDVDVQKTYDQIYFEVTTIYRNTQLVKSQLSFIDTIILNTEKVLENFRLLASAKLANQSDISKLELKISTLSLQKSNMETTLQQLYNGLQLMTGSTTRFDVTDSLVMIDLQKYESNGNKELDIIGLQEELISIDLKTLQRSKFIPEFGFIATYGTQGFGYDKSPGEFLNFYPIGYAGLRVSYPLFNGTVTNKRIYQKELELENLKLKEKSVVDLRKVEIENAVLKMENAFQNVELSGKQMELAELIYEQEEKKHREGLVSINDILLAQNELIQNQQNYLLSIAQFLAADLELKSLTNNISNY